MADRYTITDVRTRADVINAYMRKLGAPTIKVESYAPGDGVRRYTITTSSGYRIMHGYGSRDAWEKLNAFMEGIHHIADTVDRGQFQAV